MSENQEVIEKIMTDNRLSWKAKGIFLYATYFINEDFITCQLFDKSVDDKNSVYEGLKELETFGYIDEINNEEDI